MSLKSEWLNNSELYEINEKGLFEFLYKQKELLLLFEYQRKDVASKYEKLLLNNVKEEINNSLLNTMHDNKVDPMNDIDCENIMDKIYYVLQNLYEFVELQYLN